MKIAENGCPVDFLGAAVFQVLEKRRQREFGLVENQMIHFPELIRFRGEKRSAGNDFQPSRLAAVDDVFRGLPLNGHSSDEGHIRPSEIVLREPVHVDIHKPLVKFFRQHGRDGEQAQRGVGRFLPDKFQRVFEAPKRVRKSRVDQQYVQVGCLLWLLFH
jgi:hypothetical protein